MLQANISRSTADGVSTADVVSITSVVSKCCSDHGVCSIAIVTHAHGTKRPSHVLAPDRCRIDHVRHTAAGETVGSGGNKTPPPVPTSLSSSLMKS